MAKYLNRASEAAFSKCWLFFLIFTSPPPPPRYNNWGLKLSQKQERDTHHLPTAKHGPAHLPLVSKPALRLSSAVKSHLFSSALVNLLVDTPVVMGNFWPLLCCFCFWAESSSRGLWAAESQRWHFWAEAANTQTVSP